MRRCIPFHSLLLPSKFRSNGVKLANRWANFGCGSVYNEDFFDNYDYRPIRGKVIKADLRAALKIESKRYDLCYSSHALEHLSYHKGIAFLGEVYRILAPKGTIRIVVPDLEAWALEYISRLEVLRKDPISVPAARKNYEFIVALLVDDMTKETISGVKMPLLDSGYYDTDYVQKVSGLKVTNKSSHRSGIVYSDLVARKIKSFWASKDKLSLLMQRIYHSSLQDPRKNGYAHKWMWDEMQLRYILADIGFTNITTCSHTTSGVNGFASLALDSKDDGTPRHPLSLYIEATRP